MCTESVTRHLFIQLKILNYLCDTVTFQLYLIGAPDVGHTTTSLMTIETLGIPMIRIFYKHLFGFPFKFKFSTKIKGKGSIQTVRCEN